MKKLVKESIGDPYFSLKKVEKLIKDTEQFLVDIENDGSIKHNIPRTFSYSMKIGKNFLNSLNSLKRAIK